MNYFELHVGDYDAATAHLSMLEDAAYGRMLRIYYRTEKPLPADTKQVCRLVRAQSKPERDAVETVLQEFFDLQADGWHQARADVELQRFHAAEPERELRKANEEARLERHRRERQALFRLLVDNGQHAPWNTRIEELRRLAAPFCNESASQPATAAATRPATAPATPATATHGNVSPPPTSHLPVPSAEGRKKAPPCVGVPVLVAAGFDEATAGEFIAHKARMKAPLTERAWADHLREAERAGWSPMEAAAKVMARNWKGFEAKYVAGEAMPASRQSSAVQVQEWKRERAHSLAVQTGGLLGKFRDQPETVDAEHVAR